MIMAVSYIGGVDRIGTSEWWLWPVISLVSVSLACVFFRVAETSDSHGLKQKRALDELQRANVKLAVALDENAALHAKLLVHARRAGALGERQRIALDIHDTLAQSLAGILTQLQAAEPTFDNRRQHSRHITSAITLARESLAEARRTVHAVTPDVLADTQLPDAIESVAGRWSDTTGVETSVAATGDARPLHPDVEIALLRAAQEALENVVKQAHADRVGITLSYIDAVASLDVRDNGRGFDAVALAKYSVDSGFGLVGMRKRVHRPARELVAQGSSNREVAEQLFVSEATVKTHLLHIYSKFGVGDRAATVAIGFSREYLMSRE